ncbi:MAG: helix-turn-helix domain-containing protein [Sulfolobaceae archaeon]|nr:helix-turn-helix domain-containing protein [Sulfolobaceae archaeon]
MKRLFIVIPLLMIIPFISTVAFSSSGFVNVYYNGTVNAVLYNNVSQFILIGYNVTGLKVIGAEYYLANNTLYLKNYTSSYAVIQYDATLSRGVIQVDEKENFTIMIYLPTTVTISYIYPQPLSIGVTKNGLYNISLYSDRVILLYTTQSIPVQRGGGGESNIEIYLLLGLVVVDVVLAYLIVQTLRRGRREERIAEVQEDKIDMISSETLDERDTLVLEAIKMGTDTLAEIIRLTGLPKSTAYRRLKRLVKLGYIEEVREKGKVRYVLKKKDSDSS